MTNSWGTPKIVLVAICLPLLVSTTAKFSHDDVWPRLACYQGEKEKKEADVEESAETVPKRDSDELKCLHARSCQMCWKQTMPSKSAGEASNVQETVDFNSLDLMSDATVRPSVEIFHRVRAAD